MIIPNQKIRIQIEITCEQCDGSGEISHAHGEPSECDACDGTGYQTQYISLNELKSIMESGE